MRAVITVIGNDKTGIIAKVSNALADINVNIFDITQTTMQELLTMIMLVDISKCAVEFGEFADSLERTGREIGVVISVWHEDIFNSMHKI
ncbi:MAG: ACT domain-containing protein [Oscillospiraceae bacterium]|nr:ACT domain-containing protein [Oscillospiraceae bacterium]